MMDTGLTRRKPAELSPVRDLERQFTRTRPEPDQFSRTRGEPDQSHIRSGELDETKSKLLNQDLLISKPYASNPAGHQAINVSTNHGSYARDNLIWSSFPWSRAFLSLKNLALCRQRMTYVDDVVSTPPLPRQNDVDKLRGHVIRLNVLETSQLELDRFVIHPFVKIHVVDMTTGKYISKSEGKCVLGPNETMTTMNAQKAFVESGIDYIPPFATNCCDLRQEGIARARWNYSIILNEDASWLFNSNTILLFEILDFNKELIKEASTKLDHNHYYRIAWGYLRLAGLAKNHVGLSKVQLYKYRFQPSPSTAAYINKHYKRVPFVYYDFIYPDKRNYEGYLSVQVNGIPKPYLERVSRDARNIFEIEESDKDFNVTIGKFGNQPIGSQPYEDQGDPEYIKRQKMLLKRKRFPEDECRIPNDILFRFQSSPLGCFRLAFSPNGRYLAAACTYDNNKTVIKIFNVEDGVLRYTLKGHKNLIHDLNWHPSNRFLVSCSSDNTSKVWRVPEIEMNDIDEEESEKQLLVCTLFHPFYVYSSKFYMDRDTSTLIIATACFDAKVRVWRVDFENDRYVRSDPVCEEFLTFGANKNLQDGQPANLMEHRHPNILKFDNEGRLYVGDSVGTVHVWDLNVKFNQISLSKLREINHAELSGDPINSLMILPFGKKRMLVHSRDNCIRTIDYSHPSGTKVLGRYFGSKSAKFSIRSVSSPDGQYVLSGSEDGKIYLWDFNTGDIYNTEHLGLSFVGPVTDVDWNQSYHMIAVSGFGDQYPILVFTSEVQEDEEFQKVLDRMKSFDDTSRRLDHDELSPRARRVMPEREEPGEHSFRPDFQKRRTFE